MKNSPASCKTPSTNCLILLTGSRPAKAPRASCSRILPSTTTPINYWWRHARSSRQFARTRRNISPSASVYSRMHGGARAQALAHGLNKLQQLSRLLGGVELLPVKLLRGTHHDFFAILSVS